jgi:hypothetical protein
MKAHYYNRRFKDLKKQLNIRINSIEKAIELAHRNKANNWQVVVAIIIGVTGLVIAIFNLIK